MNYLKSDFMIIVEEEQFSKVFCDKLSKLQKRYDYVTGPGRSGAIASVYASHFLGIPFVPYKHKIEGKIPLIVDTAMMTGETLRKASRFYNDADYLFAFDESIDKIHIRFWYEKLSMKRGKGNEYGGKNND